MKVVMFYHSLISDWNHGNAHFLRGIVTELMNRGIDVTVCEPYDSWSYQNLVADYGESVTREFYSYYPTLTSIRYSSGMNLENVLSKADLVIVHEWNDHDLVKTIGEQRKKAGFKVLFHDTHHRMISEKEKMKRYDLSNYDGVLAYGEVIRRIYLNEGWTNNAWTWHEAADINIFKPVENTAPSGDLVWIGNWGDDERSQEIEEFLIKPVKQLGLRAKVYGVRYPPEALNALNAAGIEYGGWLPNYKVPEVFSAYRLTIHIPRRPYAKMLPGIPTIRPFEAMACGIPLISAPWDDVENLFTQNKDYLMVHNGTDMADTIQRLLNNGDKVNRMKEHAINTIRAKHSCAIRVNELLTICEELGININLTQRIAS